MGCLLAPFRLLFLLAVIILLILGWLYRDRLGDIAGAAWREARGMPSAVADSGAPSVDALAAARKKVSDLAAGRADSVVLTADEAASLLRDGLDPIATAFFDSMRVRLGAGRIAVGAQVRTGRLPAELLGPFSGALREREPVVAEGPLRVTGPAQGAWDVQRLQVRDIPLPRDAVPRLLGRALGDSAVRAVPVRLPRGVSAVTIRPDGLTLHGSR